MRPAACTRPSYFGGTGLRRMPSMMRNTRRPPSSAGSGSRFITPRLMEMNATSCKNARMFTRAVTAMVEATPTGPDRSFTPTLPPSS